MQCHGNIAIQTGDFFYPYSGSGVEIIAGDHRSDMDFSKRDFDVEFLKCGAETFRNHLMIVRIDFVTVSRLL
ncbi:MAG: hypothetical protein BWY82_01605 [Verrucomicrobia bacterium ADurb.Bin474]|nr:MAG: hypothetical protein BWY82_01605 [Verrucomicrobia bacterium ADurb.Bin474]